MTRRGFLRRLGLAPVAIPLAVQEMATAPSLAERARAWYLRSSALDTTGIAIARRWAAAENFALGSVRRFERTQRLINRRLAARLDDEHRRLVRENPWLR